MGILDTLQRIPSEYVAALISVLGAWVFLHLEQNKHTRAALSGLTFEFLFVYIVIARLSGLLLHPRELVQWSVWTLLAEAPAAGWVFGLIGAVLALLWRLRQQKMLNWVALQAGTNAALAGIGMWWMTRVFIDHGPFLIRTLSMLVVTAILLLFSLRKRATPVLAHRLWTLMAAALLLTSIGLPKITQLGLFTPVEWFAVLMLFAGLGVEAAFDIQNKRTFTITERKE